MNDDLKNTYNKIAEDWFSDHNSDTWWIEGTDHLASLLPQGASVLDIGCGAGHKSKYLSEKGFKVTGGDFSEEMVKIAKREVPGVNFQVLDLYNLAVLSEKNEKFDCVFAQAVLLHIPKSDVQQIISNMGSLLNQNGLLYVAVKEIWDGNTDEETLTENDYGYEYKRFFSYYTTEELEGYFKNAGLEVVYKNVNKVGRTNWIQIIGKKV
ncbi:class I SAM-dependent methyltransferase [Patescibacteria group bacterium]|nr:class I SAM-dependent methyltransferase [Patescibacteria group bacterium]